MKIYNDLGDHIAGSGWYTTTKTINGKPELIYQRPIEELSDFSKIAQAKTLQSMGIHTLVKKSPSGISYWEVSDSESIQNLEKELIKCQVPLPLARFYQQRSR